MRTKKSSNTKIKGNTKKRIQRLTNKNASKKAQQQIIENKKQQALKQIQNDKNLKKSYSTKAGAYSGFTKYELIKEYHELVDEGYIEKNLTQQEIYDYAPYLMEQSLDQNEIERAISRGKERKAKAEAKYAAMRERDVQFGEELASYWESMS